MKTIILSFILMGSVYSGALAQTVELNKLEATWKRHKTYTLELVSAIPEDKISYKPSAESRSFAELVMHLAQSNYGFASMIVGQPTPSADVFVTRGKTKAQLMSVLSDSFEFLLKHVGTVKTSAWSDSFDWGNRLEPTTKRTRADILAILKEHAAHHRGQITVYLRLNGIEPPSFVD